MSHIGSLPPHRPAFTEGQLIEIYEAAGRSGDLSALKAKARELYPDILEDGEPPITRVEGWFGRSFEDAAGKMVHSKWVLCSNRCNSVGILADGTPMPY